MWWGDFFNDPKVAALPSETRGVYLQLLGRMWMNEGWLPDDDAILARLLGLHVLTWKCRHRAQVTPLLDRVLDPVVGWVLRQKRLTREWQKAVRSIAEVNANAARARAGKAAKSKQPRSAPAANTRSAPDVAAGHVTGTVTTAAAGIQPEPDKERALPIKKAESPFPPTGQGLGAPSGAAEEAAALASLRRKGATPTPPSPALLKTPIVKGNGHGTATEPAPDRGRDHRDQGAVPEPAAAERADAPAAGLFAALERARRKSEEEG